MGLEFHYQIYGTLKTFSSKEKIFYLRIWYVVMLSTFYYD